MMTILYQDKPKITFGTPRGGWLAIEIDGGSDTFRDVFSHIPLDSLAELVDALCGVAQRQFPQETTWNNEPGNCCFRFQAAGEDAVKLVIVRDSKAHPEAEWTFQVHTLALTFWRALRRLEDAFQTIGADDWTYAFPAHAVARLESYVKPVNGRS